MNNKTAQQLIEELNLEDELFKSHYYPVTPEAFDDSEVYDGTMQDYLLDLLSERFGYSTGLEQLADEIMELLADKISSRIMENDKNYQEDYEASEEAWRQR